MSGHSKWHNIAAKKSKTDAARGAVFTKIGRELAVAAKGNPNPETNSKLADVIAKAKAANMPNDNIKRSIARAAGELSGKDYKELTYEGYGVAGSAVIIKTLTDNVNRTSGDISSTMSKCGGQMGKPGCVSYQFDNKGVIVIEKTVSLDEDTMMEYCLEAEAEDFASEEDVYEVYTTPEAFSTVRKYFEDKGVTFLEAEVKMVPQNTITLPEDKVATFVKMIDKLEEQENLPEDTPQADREALGAEIKGCYDSINGLLDGFSTAMDKMVQVNESFGAETNKLEMSDESLADNKLNLKDYISGIQDLDITEAISDWYSSQMAYQASMQASTSIMSMSLLNYM